METIGYALSVSSNSPSAIATISSALSVLTLAILATQSVVATLGYAFLGVVRDLVRNHKDSIHAQYARELRAVQDQIGMETTLNSQRLAEKARFLKSKERRLRANITHFDRALKCLDTRYTLMFPVALLLLTFIAATATQVVPAPYNLLSLSAGFVFLGNALFLIARQLTDLQFLAGFTTPHVASSVTTPPQWICGQQYKITIRAVLTTGRALHNLHIFVYLPPTFQSTAAFLDKLKCPSDDPERPHYNVISTPIWPALSFDVPYVYDFDRLRGTNQGQMTLFYRVTSDEWAGPFEPIHVNVVQPAR